MNNLSDKHKQVLQCAIDIYGREAQRKMIIEEMAELTKAICKEDRASKAFNAKKSAMLEAENAVIEEMADVQIMLWQMHLMYPDCNNYIDKKIDRLAGRLGINKQEPSETQSPSELMKLLSTAAFLGRSLRNAE